MQLLHHLLQYTLDLISCGKDIVIDNILKPSNYLKLTKLYQLLKFKQNK